MKLKLKNRVVRHAIKLLELYEQENQDDETNAKQCRKLLRAARDYRNIKYGKPGSARTFAPAENN